MSRNRPCRDRHPQPQPATCAICRGWTANSGRAANVPNPTPAYRPCRFRGDLLHQMAVKFNCHEDPPKRIPLVACAEFGNCTLVDYAIDENGKRIACCRTCHRQQPLPEVTIVPPVPTTVRFPAIRQCHLAYFLLPVAGTGIWQAQIDRLRTRWHQFTNKTVAVATGGPVQGKEKSLRLDSLAVVRSYLPSDCQVIPVVNVPSLWEGAAWPELWKTVLAKSDPNDAIFYAHAKGVTHPPDTVTVRHWVRLLYSLCLDYPALLHERLQCCPVAGPLRRPVALFPSSRWYYSGNFWWVRAGEMQARWAKTPLLDHHWAAEAWVGSAFPITESGVLGPLSDVDDLDTIYKPEWWDRHGPERDQWMIENPPARFEAIPATLRRPTLSIIIPTSGNRETLGRAIESCRTQLAPGDELIVKLDRTHDWGHTARNQAMPQATGDYLLFLDDDDVYEAGALDVVRGALAENPSRPHLFRMRRGAPFHDVIWKAPELLMGNVSTQMIVVPNNPERLGEWGRHQYEGDFAFIQSTLAKYPADAAVWREEPIAVWRA